MPPQSLTVPAPVGGVSRSAGFQAQPSNTSVRSINFLPFDPRTGRRISSVRPAFETFESPGAGVNMMARLHGDASQSPQSTVLVALDGVLYYWNGATWVEVTDDDSKTVTIDRQVFAQAFLKDLFIMNDTATLVFNYDAKTLRLASDSVSEGSFPTDCRIIAAWQGGIWVAGAEDSPHVLQGSRTGDAFDWDFTVEDIGGAIILTGEDEGLIGREISALAPFSLDSMVVATPDTLHVMRGHPRRGGVFEQISDTQGILGNGAWCLSPQNVMFFLSKSGICALKSPDGPATLVSFDKIPDDLIALTYDYLDPKINMEYDSRWNGILITVRGDEEQAWWFDEVDGGFHELTMADYPIVMDSIEEFTSEGTSGILMGGEGYGGLTRMNTNATESFVYNLVSGPIRIAKQPSRNSMIQRANHFLSGNTVATTGDVIRIWTGGSPEDVYRRLLDNNKAFRNSYDVSDLIANGGRTRPRLTGNAAIIELYGTGGSTSSLTYESTELELMPAGRNKSTLQFVPAGADKAPIFAAEDWDLYAETTISSYGEEGFILLIDLSKLPDEWWAVVQSDGDDIRATTSFNNLMPIDVLDIDTGTKTGCIAVRQTSQFALIGNGTIRLYAGNATVAGLAASNENGQDFVYFDDVFMFVPPSTQLDRTSASNDFDSSTITAVTEGGGASLFGLASDRVELDGFGGLDSFARGNNVAGETFTDGATVVTYVRPIVLDSGDTGTSSVAVMTVGRNKNPAGSGLAAENNLRIRIDPINTVTKTSNVSGSNDYDIVDDTSIATGSFYQIGVRLDGSTEDHELLVNGVEAPDTPTDPFAITPADFSFAMSFTEEYPLGGGSGHQGDVGLFIVYNDQKTDTYLALQYSMLDQDTFYGTWSIPA